MHNYALTQEGLLSVAGLLCSDEVQQAFLFIAAAQDYLDEELIRLCEIPAPPFKEAARADYMEFCKSTIPAGMGFDDFKIVVDASHGAAYKVAPRVISDLGADVVAVGCSPNGRNINDGCGSTRPDLLKLTVTGVRAHVGLALDGDGDRVVMVDERGSLVDGDQLLYILARDRHESNSLRGPVVGTLMTNYGFERALGERGIGFVRARVGDRYVHQQLLANDGVLGGEASGHILCLDRASTGDGIVSALQVLEVLQRRGIGLAEALHGLRKVPQKTVNVRYAGAARPADADNVHIALAEAQRAVEGRGRAFLRASGTEPVVRVTVEADDAALVESTLSGLVEAVRAAAA